MADLPLLRRLLDVVESDLAIVEPNATQIMIALLHRDQLAAALFEARVELIEAAEYWVGLRTSVDRFRARMAELNDPERMPGIDRLKRESDP